MVDLSLHQWFIVCSPGCSERDSQHSERMSTCSSQHRDQAGACSSELKNQKKKRKKFVHQNRPGSRQNTNDSSSDSNSDRSNDSKGRRRPHRSATATKPSFPDRAATRKRQHSSSSGSESSSSCDSSDSCCLSPHHLYNRSEEELEKKRNCPHRLHPELWHNDREQVRSASYTSYLITNTLCYLLFFVHGAVNELHA